MVIEVLSKFGARFSKQRESYIKYKSYRVQTILRRLIEDIKYRKYISSFIILKFERFLPQNSIQKLRRRMEKHFPGDSVNDYRYWIKLNDELTSRDRRLIQNHIKLFKSKPKFSILVSVSGNKIEYLREAIKSIKSQLYENWELIIVNHEPLDNDVKNFIKEILKKDFRIKAIIFETIRAIPYSTNEALALVTGEWLVFFDHGDRLNEHALYLCAETINRKADAVLIYSDEDYIDQEGQRYSPYFKSDWNYELFLGQNMIGRSGVYKTNISKQIGGLRNDIDGAYNWDFTLRYLEVVPHQKIYHIPFVLYHSRQYKELFLEDVLAIEKQCAQQVVYQHLMRMKQRAKVEQISFSNMLRIKRELPEQCPLVSIIIPTRDKYKILNTCIEGLLNRTDYKPIEIIIVDNGSKEPDAVNYLKQLKTVSNIIVLEYEGHFNFSYLVNLGVKASSGEVCVLLNNDISIINSDWLDELVVQALRPHVGAVGAKLYYKDNSIQHAGVILGLANVAGHIEKRKPRNSDGYFGRLKITHELSCVTGACLAVRRRVFFEVGGLNEQELKVSFNDVDFCLKIRRAGYTIIWAAYAELYHYESLSRGVNDTLEKKKRHENETRYMWDTWESSLKRDPYYNENLKIDDFDYSIALTSRVQKIWNKPTK